MDVNERTWSKEPWQESEEPDLNGHYVIVGDGDVRDPEDKQELLVVTASCLSNDDACRIVACVNALEGIPDPAAFMAAHRKLIALPIVSAIAVLKDDS